MNQTVKEITIVIVCCALVGVIIDCFAHILGVREF